MKDYFFLALNNLKRRKLRAWLTMLGIFIGIASVVALISLGAGLKEAITGQFSSLSTDRLVIQNSGTGFGPPGSTAVRKLNEHDLSIIKGIEGVEEVIPRYIRIGKIEYNKEAEFLYISNLQENDRQSKIFYESFNLKAEAGRLLKAEDRGKILIGKEVAEETFDKKIEAGKKVKIQGREFEVIGILKSGSNFQLNHMVILPLKDLKEILEIKDEMDILVVKVKRGYDLEEVAKKIEKRMKKDRNLKEGEEDFSVQTPLQAISAVNNILNIINAVVIGIAAISLIVGGIGIANTMYTSVLERTREIGTMKAVGARNSDILGMYIIESGFLGLVGGIIGAILGLLLAFSASSLANSYFQGEVLKISFSAPLFFGAISFAFFIGLFSGLLPALQASKLKPVDALRA